MKGPQTVISTRRFSASEMYYTTRVALGRCNYAGALFKTMSKTIGLRQQALVRIKGGSNSISSKVMPGVGAGDKLERLRDILMNDKSFGVDAFVVPTNDPHLSEYVAAHFDRRQFLSGFTGSSGTALVTQREAMLWTDGRYFIQAEKELDPTFWNLMRMGQRGVPTLENYLRKKAIDISDRGGANVPPYVIGIDPLLHSIAWVERLEKSLQGLNAVIKYLPSNPIDKVWEAMGRPVKPTNPVRVHSLSYAGRTVKEKLKEIRDKMDEINAEGENNVQGIFMCALDEVCWAYNIRGSDVPYSTVTLSYALVSRKEAYLFIDQGKLSDEVKEHLKSENVHIMDYDSAPAMLQTVFPPKTPDLSFPLSPAKVGKKKPSQILLDPNTINAKMKSVLHSDVALVKPSPVPLLKAVKNEKELEGMRRCHVRDAAALVDFIAWMSTEVTKRTISETEIDERLLSFRQQREGFLTPSFPTIAGVGENAAIIHYRATKGKSEKELDCSQVLLLDSGAQYVDGTTDVTRVLHFGTPTGREKECYTRCLKGHIAIDSAVFPAGTPGFVLDVLARKGMWAVGMDFAHGTGHGVGAALNVHEGPQSISTNWENSTPLMAGMVVSNEPGYYDYANRFGIRIENLLAVAKNDKLSISNDPRGREYLCFERLTYVPIATNLIQRDLLDPWEVKWINLYHEEVRQKVMPLLTSESSKDWLIEATKEY